MMNLFYFILFICEVFVVGCIIKSAIEYLLDKENPLGLRLLAGLGIVAIIIVIIVVVAYCISQAPWGAFFVVNLDKQFIREYNVNQS